MNENNLKKTIYSLYDFSTGSHAQLSEIVDDLLERWISISRLYDVIVTFASSFPSVANQIEIKSYNYTKLVIGYGPNKSYMVRSFCYSKLSGRL